MKFVLNAMSEQRISLIKEMFNASVSEFTNAQNSFNALDTKAQNTTTIAGIFLASILAFLNSEILQKFVATGKLFSVIILGTVTVFLIFATLFCLFSIIIRDTPTLKLKNIQNELEAILKQPEKQLETRYENFLLSRIREWINIANELRETNQKKATMIFLGQICLMVSIISMAFLMSYTLVINR